MSGGSSFPEPWELEKTSVDSPKLFKKIKVPSDMVFDIKRTADELSNYITNHIAIMKHPAVEDILGAYEHLVRAMDNLYSYTFYQDGYEVKEEEEID